MLDMETIYARAMVMLSCTRHLYMTMLMSDEQSINLFSMKIETQRMTKQSKLKNASTGSVLTVAVRDMQATFIDGALSYG